MSASTRLTWVAFAQTAAVALRMILAVAVARTLSTEDFGAYSVVMNVVALASVVTMGGWPSYLLAVAPKDGMSRQLMTRALRGSGKILLLVVSIEIVVLMLLLGDQGSPALIIAGAVLLAAMTWAGVENEGLRATDAVVAARLSSAVTYPAVGLTTIGIASLFGGVHVAVVVAAVGLGWASLWVVSRFFIRRRFTPYQGVTQSLEYSRNDLLVTKIAQAVLSSSDVLLVSFFASIEEAALYAVARRITVVAGFGLTTVTMVHGPRLSRQARDAVLLKKATKQATLTSLVISIPIILAIVVLGEWLLSLFGAEYRGAYQILLILLVGSGFNALAGPIGTVVNVNGQERMSRRVMLWSALAYLVVSPLALLWWGMLGAAVTWTLITVAWNGVLWLKVDYTVGARRAS